ncbi:hypothetical protein B0A55_11661, partial [Friedmanniomyces simplex]
TPAHACPTYTVVALGVIQEILYGVESTVSSLAHWMRTADLAARVKGVKVTQGVVPESVEAIESLDPIANPGHHRRQKRHCGPGHYIRRATLNNKATSNHKSTLSLGMPKIYIAVYTPRQGNHYHWAIYVKCKPPRIIEITGSHPEFKFNTVETKPENTTPHKESIEIGDINDSDMPEFYSIMRRVEIDNDTVDWNCQDYVLEALDELTEECVLDEDDETYKKGRRRAKNKYYGPQ